MSVKKPVVDYYSLLEVDRRADHAAIGAAVRAQRRRWVGRQNSPSLEKQREAEDRLVSIAAAQLALLAPTKRRIYDNELESASVLPPIDPAGSAAAPPPPPPPPAPAPHNWLAEARAELDNGD